MLIIPLIPATALIVFWLLLLKSSTKEDWATGAYNQVLDNRMAIEKLQKKDRENAEKLAEYIEDSVRFYHCQFIISTHSPFLLSMNGVKIYDLDSCPASVRKWSELENMRLYYRLFEEHQKEFV